METQEPIKSKQVCKEKCRLLENKSKNVNNETKFSLTSGGLFAIDQFLKHFKFLIITPNLGPNLSPINNARQQF